MDEKWQNIMSCCIKVIELLYNKQFKKGNPVSTRRVALLGA